MDKVEFILKRSLAKKGLLGAARSAEICFLAEKAAKGRFQAISFSRGVLKVSAASSAAAQEINMDEERIIDEINHKLGNEAVKRVRIILRS